MDDKKFDEAIKVLAMLRADVIEHGKKLMTELMSNSVLCQRSPTGSDDRLVI